MKLFLVLLLLTAQSLLAAVTIVSGPPSGTFVTDLNTGLFEYWKMEEASGTRIDSEPTATTQDLADNATVTQTTGIIGNAASFASATSEFLSHADSTELSVGNIDWSVALWVNFTTTNATQTLISQNDATGNQRSWVLFMDSTTGGTLKFQVSATGTSTVVAREATTFGLVPPSTWLFIYASHDSANNLLKISVNDGVVDSTAHTTGVFDSTAQFRIGASVQGGFVNGAIDEVALFKKVLTAADVTKLYNAGAGITCCPFPP